MVRGVTYVLLQPVRIHTLMLHSFHSYCFVIKKGTEVSVKQSTKTGLNLWLIPGDLSVDWWLCSFRGGRLFRQKKSKCKILAISFAIERNVIKMCFKHYYFMISLLSSTTLLFYLLKCSLLKFHVSLCLHHTDFRRETPIGKILFTSWCECLGRIVLKGLAALWNSLHSLVTVVPWKCWVSWTAALRTLHVWLVGPHLRVW